MRQRSKNNIKKQRQDMASLKIETYMNIYEEQRSDLLGLLHAPR